MRKKQLIFICPAFPDNDNSTHIVPFIQQFTSAFNTQFQDIKIIIVSLYLSKKSNYIWKNIEVISLGLNNELRVFRFINFFKGILKTYSLIKKNKTIGILSFWYTDAAIIGSVVAFLKNVKHYTWLQGQDVLKSNKYMRLFRPKINSLLALSNFQNEMFIKSFNKHAFKIVPIGINPSFFPKLNSGNRPYDLMCAASLIPLKNISLFLEIALEVKSRYENIKIIIAGSGPMKNELEEFVEKNGLKGNVTFTGLIPHKETLNLMNNSKILLHTSKFEGGGCVCYEALYSGCNVICTIPLISNKNISTFYYLKNKSEITTKIIEIINHFNKPKRTIVNDINESGKIIYDLYI